LINFNQVPLYDGWTPLGNTGSYTGFSTSASGIYLITYSANFETSFLAPSTADFRVLLNNTEILGSQASAAALNSSLPIRPSNTFTVSINPTGTIGYQFAASATSGQLTADGNSNAGVPIAKQQTAFTTSITKIN